MVVCRLGQNSHVRSSWPERTHVRYGLAHAPPKCLKKNTSMGLRRYQCQKNLDFIVRNVPALYIQPALLPGSIPTLGPRVSR